MKTQSSALLDLDVVLFSEMSAVTSGTS